MKNVIKDLDLDDGIEGIYTLRIKKEYFDLIREKKKKVEYREFKKFYKNAFKNPEKIKVLKLHYQGDELLYIAVRKISLIDTPKKIKENSKLEGLRKSNKIYEIKLGNILKHINKTEGKK